MGTCVVKPKLGIIWRWVGVEDIGLLNTTPWLFRTQSTIIYQNDKSHYPESCAFLLPASSHQVAFVKLWQQSPYNFIPFWLKIHYPINFLLGRFFPLSYLQKLTEKLSQFFGVLWSLFFSPSGCITSTSIFSTYHLLIKRAFISSSKKLLW